MLGGTFHKGLVGGALLPLLRDRIDYVGQRWWVNYLPRQIDMIQAQPWFREIPFERLEGRLGTHFMTGGYMAIRSQCIREANLSAAPWNGAGIAR